MRWIAFAGLLVFFLWLLRGLFSMTKTHTKALSTDELDRPVDPIRDGADIQIH